MDGELRVCCSGSTKLSWQSLARVPGLLSRAEHRQEGNFAEFQALAASPFPLWAAAGFQHHQPGAHTAWSSAFLPLPPKASAFLGEVVVVFLCLLTSTKLPDGISMLCRETGTFYYRCHVDAIHLHSQKWSKAFAHCIGKECSAPSRDPEGLLWDIVAL